MKIKAEVYVSGYKIKATVRRCQVINKGRRLMSGYKIKAEFRCQVMR